MTKEEVGISRRNNFFGGFGFGFGGGNQDLGLFTVIAITENQIIQKIGNYNKQSLLTYNTDELTT